MEEKGFPLWKILRVKVIIKDLNSFSEAWGKIGYKTKMFRYQLFTVLKSVKATVLKSTVADRGEGPEGAAPLNV